MSDPSKNTAEAPKKWEKISAFEPGTLIFSIILAILSGAICMQIIGSVGFTPNTSLLGAIFAMVVARIPLTMTKKFRNLERQNLVQTMVSGAGFSAANCGFIALAIMFLMGRTDLMMPMALGSILATGIGIFSVGRIFDSKIFPATGAWPPGVATARALEAGDEGGEKGKRLLQGLGVGILGSIVGIPVAGIGIVFIANLASMIALGTGLVIRGYSVQLFDFNFATTNIPQGLMIGAGFVALGQSLVAILSKKASKGEDISRITVSDQQTRVRLLSGLGMHLVGALATAAITGILTDMSVGKIIIWTIWCAFSATVAMLLVGMAAMKSGWFPAFAITTIFLTIGLLLGFPPIALAVMTGYITSVGPCFADMGYDLKTGWIIRGQGTNSEHEMYGRRQQIVNELIGGIIGIVVVMLFGSMMMNQDLFPPVSHTFVSTIGAAADMSLLKELALWAIPGAVLQFAFGTRSVGVLFATGMLLTNPIYGVGVLAACVIRSIFGTKFMEVRDAGLIAGDGLYGFFSNLVKSLL